MIISIINAQYKGDYKIAFKFSDNTTKVVDFKAFLMDAKNPMTKKYQDESLFKNFTIEYGDIQWNNFELCFPIWNLYQGDIE